MTGGRMLFKELNSIRLCLINPEFSAVVLWRYVQVFPAYLWKYLYSCSEAEKKLISNKMINAKKSGTMNSNFSYFVCYSDKVIDGNMISLLTYTVWWELPSHHPTLTFTWVLAQIINSDDISHLKSSISHLKDPIDAIFWRETCTKIRRMKAWRLEILRQGSKNIKWEGKVLLLQTTLLV